MRASLAITMGLALALVAFPVLAQVGGSSGGSAAGGVGAIGGVGGVGGVDGIGGVGGSSFGSSGIDDGSISTPPGAVDSSVTDPVQPDSLGAGGGSDSGAASATRGDPATADGLASSETGGTAATSTPGGGDDEFRSTMDRSSLPQLYRIPTPTVDVDLGAIRRAMAAGPSATPKANGD